MYKDCHLPHPSPPRILKGMIFITVVHIWGAAVCSDQE